jgi:putative DNA primase/helicase
MTNKKTMLERKLLQLRRVQGWAIKSESAGHLNAMVALTRSEVPVLPEQLDRAPWLLNCPNGTLELRTGILREHRREDMLTKLCPTEYNPDAACPAWERLLDGIFDRDAELIGFVQRLLGYALTGDVREQVLPIFHGAGGNGKSTLLTAVQEVLGTDYAMTAGAELLLQPRGERHPTERADLFGKRLVITSETEEGRHLNESLVKSFTGGDRIRARRVREDSWEFDPTHKIILVTNHRPKIRGTDEGIWRRVLLVPFEVQFLDPDDPRYEGQEIPPERIRDKGISGRLKLEYQGVLSWLVRGCLDWQRGGLRIPDKVRAATTSYRESEDVLASFLAEKAVYGPSLKVKAGEFYKAFKKWCEDVGEHVLSQRDVGELMTARGIEKKKSNGWRYHGLTVPTSIFGANRGADSGTDSETNE